MSRLRDWLTFRVERLLLRGAYVRLLIIAGLVAFVSLSSGFLLMLIDSSERPEHAIWWAFLRLSDPGYLGDDEGVAKRMLGTAVTVLGYVLFMGSLVAIMTQWLNDTMRRLEQGLTRIFQSGHVLVCGWTSRTSTIAREMFEMEGRVRRFLALRDRSSLSLVLMVEKLSAELREELRTAMGAFWRENQIVLRSGSSLHIDHLQRVDYLRAAAILLPSEDLGVYSGNEDARTIKTLMAIAHSGKDRGKELPTVVTEIFDSRKIGLARRAYRGPLEIVASDRLAGQLLALCTLYPGMGHVFDEMLAYGRGSELHITETPVLVGRALSEISSYFPRAVVVGLAKPSGDSFEAELCTAPDRILARGERLVLLASNHEDAAPSKRASKVTRTARRHPQPPPKSLEAKKVLVVGFSDRVLDLVLELELHHGGPLTIDILSAVSTATREDAMRDRPLARAHVRNFEGDTSRLSVMQARLAEGYDHIVLVASDNFASYSQSDARTIVAYLLIEEVMQTQARRPNVVVELMDVGNRALLDVNAVDVVVSPLVIGRVLAHVAVRPELRCVYNDLLDAVGPCIGLVRAQLYDVANGVHVFSALMEAIDAYGDVLLGVMPTGAFGELVLNAPKAESFDVTSETLLVVLGF